MDSNNERGLSIFIILITLAFLVVIILMAIVKPENNITQITALVGTLTALVSVIWTQYNKNIEETNKQKQFELDKKNQITKETYQKLFEDKMKLYKELHSNLFNYKIKLIDVGRDIYNFDEDGSYHETITEEAITIQHFKDLLSTLKKNSFIISNEIEDIYKILYIAYKQKESQFDNILEVGAYNDDENLRTENQRLNKELFAEHQKNINKLVEQLECEIKIIKTEIGFL